QRAPLCCTSTPPSTPLNVHRARVRRKRGRLRSHGSAILGQRSVSHASRLCTGFPPETEGCDTQRRTALQQCNLSPTINSAPSITERGCPAQARKIRRQLGRVAIT